MQPQANAEMNGPQPYVGIALRDGILVTIDEVESGLACGCICPACDAPLVAKKGKIRTHHFSHQGVENCQYFPESIAHHVAKEILQVTKRIMTPPVYVKPAFNCIYPYTDVRFDHVHAERKLGEIVPDIIGEVGGKQLLIEIVVTNPPTQEKIQKIIGLGLSAVEIVIYGSEVLTKEAIRRSMQTTGGTQRWIFNTRAAQQRRLLDGPDCDGPGWEYNYQGYSYAYFPTQRLATPSPQ